MIPITDVVANVARVFAVLEAAGIAYTAESYGPDDDLLQEWRAGITEPGPAPSGRTNADSGRHDGFL